MNHERRRVSVVGPSVVTPTKPTLTAPGAVDVYPGVAATVSATVTAGQVPDRVDFVLDPGVNEIVVAGDSSSPYSQNWTPAQTVGDHTIVARYVYGSGHVDSDSTSISIFDPTYFIGGTLWLRADTVTESPAGDASAWTDKFAGTTAFSQGTDSKKPKIIANAYSGKPTLRGVDTTTILLAGAPVSLGTACTIALVMTRASAANKYLFGSLTGGKGIVANFTGGLVEWYNSSGDRYTLADTPTGLHIATVTQVNAGALVGYWDGTQAFSHTATQVLSNINAIFNDTSAANGGAFDIPELVVYPSVLSGPSLSRLHNYLGTRYGITV